MFFVYLVVTNSYKIGVDGGGTKTELILVDAAGNITARHTAAGCNPNQVGPEQARTLLMESLQALCTGLPAGSVHRTLLCMAGNRVFWRQTADALTGYGTITTTDDSLPVLELATDGAPGLALHAGTGSFVVARAPDGSIHYTGGLGWKIGDPGSGYDIGRRGIAAAMLELQARPAVGHPPLAAALCTHTGLPDYPAISRFFYNDAAAHAQIVAFAPRVIELAAQDCGPARQALADSITDLARIADGVLHRLFPPPVAGLPCGVSGRILNSAPAAALLRSLAGKLNWPVALRGIDPAPIEGVRRLLLKGS